MHELVVTKNILSMALRYAKANDASQVKTIFLRIGALRDIEPEWLTRYFRFVSKGTMAEGAEVLIMSEPIVFRCHSCGEAFHVDLNKPMDEELPCPRCFANDHELISGTEFIISSIEVV